MKMKLAAAALALACAPVFAADVGVAVSVNQPGLYGVIQIGDFPQPPPVIYREPVIVEKVTVVHESAPVYMHVPPGHAKHWDKHCHEYHACSQRVLFVEDSWYEKTYVPYEQEKHHGKSKGKKHKGKGHGHD